MSWWGSGPHISRAQARALLGPAPCRLTVIWVRTMIGSVYAKEETPAVCPRCGLLVDIPALRKEAERRGWLLPTPPPPW